MRDEYDFSNARPNPFLEDFSTKITIRLGNDVIEYFKEEAARTGLGYQRLINMFLRQCVANEMHLTFVEGGAKIE